MTHLGEAVKDVVYGSLAGGFGKVIEYPFDTVKVRLQSQHDKQFKGPLDCFRKSIRQEGVLGLYRGVMSPIFGAAAETASLFVTYNLAQRVVGLDGNIQALVCGSISGACTSFILTPIELVKCKMQVQGSHGTAELDMFKLIGQIYKQYGMMGFWKGQMGTLLRETGGSAAWFGAYEYMGKVMAGHNDKSPIQSMISGACAGIAYNVSLFPADTIKSRIQTMDVQRGFVAVGRDIVREGGIKALYRGCGITVCRSAPSSAIIFFTYETLKAF